jgi:hypothetical protein
MTMKISKKQLESLIRESVEKALEGLDFGDRDWLRSRQDDEAQRRQAASSSSGLFNKKPETMPSDAGQPSVDRLKLAVRTAVKKIAQSGNRVNAQKAINLQSDFDTYVARPDAKNMQAAMGIARELINMAK